MAILKIARMGHPVLREKAASVADPGAPDIRALVADMIETMRDTGGTGLAAPQVHVGKRVVVFEVGDTRLTGRPLDRPQELTVLINPVIEPLTTETELGWEGCLSVPGLKGAVPRFTRIRYRGVDLDGAPIDRTVEGFHARVLQHECDHLDGILYPQRMTDLRLLTYLEEGMRFPIDIGVANSDADAAE
ncbi:MAG TPA: peptide deformylase [Stellaceae bacterium]|nr:peptide deformylase [Stellaceae bacterium]